MEPHPTRAKPLQGPAGPAIEILGRGRTPGAFAVRRDGIAVESPRPADLVVARMTVAPGSASHRRTHPGPLLAVVTRGSLTRYAAEDCDAETFTSGVAFVEDGSEDGTMIRNEGAGDAEVIVVLLASSMSLLHPSL